MSTVSGLLPVTQNPNNPNDLIRAAPVCNPDGSKIGSSSPASPVFIAGSGISASASFTPIAGAYSANDLMGTTQQFTFLLADGSAIPTGSLIRILTVTMKIDQTALQTAEGAYALKCFSVTPPSALSDNAAWTLQSGDLPSYRGSIDLGTPVDEGSACYVTSVLANPKDIRLTTASIFAYLQTVAGLTVAASPAVRQIFLDGIIL